MESTYTCDKGLEGKVSPGCPATQTLPLHYGVYLTWYQNPKYQILRSLKSAESPLCFAFSQLSRLLLLWTWGHGLDWPPHLSPSHFPGSLSSLSSTLRKKLAFLHSPWSYPTFTQNKTLGLNNHHGGKSFSTSSNKFYHFHDCCHPELCL